MPKTETLKQKVVVSASPADVYDAFMDPRKHSEFTGSKATCDPRVDGEFTAWDGYIYGKNIELQPGKRIFQEWSTSEWPPKQSPSRLELIFTKVKGGTEIQMIHSNVPAEQVADVAQGWIDFYWDPLKGYFKKHVAKKAS